MSGNSVCHEAKLSGERLVAHVRTGSSEPLSVLVQPGLPSQPRPLSIRVPGQPPVRGSVGRTVEDSVMGDRAEAYERVTTFLTELLGSEPTWLGAARVFVVSVTPAELRQVTLHPEVRTVYLNQEVRLRSSERKPGEHVPGATVDMVALSKKGEVEGPS